MTGRDARVEVIGLLDAACATFDFCMEKMKTFQNDSLPGEF